MPEKPNWPRMLALTGCGVNFAENRHSRGKTPKRRCIATRAARDCTTPAKTTLGRGEILANTDSSFDFAL